MSVSLRDQLCSGARSVHSWFSRQKGIPSSHLPVPCPSWVQWLLREAHLPWANNILQIFCRRQLSFLMPPEERFVPSAFTVHAGSSTVFLRAEPLIRQGIACFCTSASSERNGMLVLLKTLEKTFKGALLVK